MESSQLVAGAIAGFIAPFLQQTFFAGRVTGRAAAVLAAVIAFVLGSLATWMTGGFGGTRTMPAFDIFDPSAFFIFWVGIFTPVYAVSQLVYSITTKRSEAPPATGIVQDVAKVVAPLIPVLGAPPSIDEPAKAKLKKRTKGDDDPARL